MGYEVHIVVPSPSLAVVSRTPQQELLRHTDIRTTINVYTPAVSEQKRAAHSKVVQMVLAS
jgi:hypothetical protein